MDTRVMALFPIRNVVYAGETVIILALFCNRKGELVWLSVLGKRRSVNVTNRYVPCIVNRPCTVRSIHERGSYCHRLWVVFNCYTIG